MEFTGERYVSDLPHSEISYEHWHRYLYTTPFASGKSVLDIACGDGYGTHLLSRYANLAVGVDIDPETVRFASGTYVERNLKFLVGPATHIPIPGRAVFDLIVSFETIEHISEGDQAPFMSEVKRLLKPEGLFIASTPNKLVYSDIPRYQNEFHLREFYVDEFRRHLEQHFRTVTLLGQKIYPGSYIWNLGQDKGPLEEYRIEYTPKGFRQSQAPKEVLYVVAVASDGEIEIPPSSILVDLSHRMIADRDLRVATLEAKLSEKETDRASLIDNIAEKDTRIQALEQNLDRASVRMRDLEAKLATMFSSHGWKLLQTYYRLRNSLFPINSRRQLIAGFALRALRSPRSASRALDRRNLRRILPRIWPGASSPTKIEEAVPPVDTAKSDSGTRVLVARRPDTWEPASKFNLTNLDIKLIAFYLPQFHPIPENDAWWGKGFTEWTNVSAAQPQFYGHYQPRRPGELGFYDLRVPQIQSRQIELAREYGVAAFCYHFYWFAGRTLLEMPLQRHVADKKLDFPFCISWANENWTRRWDGLDHDVLIAQHHSAADDLAFIEHVSVYLKDPRYFRIDSRPVLMVYRPALLPDVKATADRWRRWCRSHGLGEIYLVLSHAFESLDPEGIGFDAAVEFAPNRFWLDDITRKTPGLKRGFRGRVYDYRSAIRLAKEYWTPPYKKFRCVCPDWDNEARQPGRAVSLRNASPDAYGEWLDHLCNYTIRTFAPSERLVFVNAWNEWAESAYLEPDGKWGYAYLNKTAEILSHYRESQQQAPAASVSKTVTIVTTATESRKVSVIVPNYNHARYLGRRLDGIFNQTYRDFEVILLDDASTDDSMSVIERYGERENVRIVRRESNSGSPFKQWLQGLSLVRGEIVWIAESDDACENEFLAVLLPAFAHGRVKVAYCNSAIIDESGVVVGDYLDGEYLGSLSRTKWRNPYLKSSDLEMNEGLGVKNTILSASSVLFRRFDLDVSAKRCLEGMRIAGDWYFIANALLDGDIWYESRKLNYHRRHNESVIARTVREGKLSDFFREFYWVQSFIFDHYRLDKEFEEKWERYLRKQWNDFCPDRPFNDINEYYPMDQMRNRIRVQVHRGRGRGSRRGSPDSTASVSDSPNVAGDKQTWAEGR